MKIRPNFDDIRKMEYNRDDKRHHYPRIEEKEQQNVVMVNIRDVSGSMREPEQELVFRTFVPINWYIEGKYGHAEMIYIVHDKEAWETDKEDFFRIKSGGGTKISSAFELTKEILEEKYPYNKWNRYIIAASDGENKRDTKENLIPLMKEIQANLQAFVQVNPGANTSSLTPNRKAAKKIADEFDIKRGRKGAKYASVEISSNNHIVDAIKRILDSSGDKKDD